jgi:hypothetical protein
MNRTIARYLPSRRSIRSPLWNVPFLLDDSHDANSRRHAESIRIIVPVARRSHTDKSMSMKRIDWDHAIYRRNNVVHRSRAPVWTNVVCPTSIELDQLDSIWPVSKATSDACNVLWPVRSFVRCFTSAMFCLKLDKIWKFSGLTVSRTRQMSQASSRYEIWACKQPLDERCRQCRSIQLAIKDWPRVETWQTHGHPWFDTFERFGTSHEIDQEIKITWM